MNVINKSSIVDLGGDTSLAVFLEALGEGDNDLVLVHGGREIKSGFHVTEVKAGEFTTVDCGGNPDHWRETILQVEDMALPPGERPMRVAKFRAILAKVGERIDLDPAARLTFEVSDAENAMQVLDPAFITLEANRVVVTLASRPATCKPRHRASQAQHSSACCGSARSQPASACCA